MAGCRHPGQSWCSVPYTGLRDQGPMMLSQDGWQLLSAPPLSSTPLPGCLWGRTVPPPRSLLSAAMAPSIIQPGLQDSRVPGHSGQFGVLCWVISYKSFTPSGLHLGSHPGLSYCVYLEPSSRALRTCQRCQNAPDCQRARCIEQVG